MTEDRTLAELIEKFQDQEKLHSTEGRRGVEHLCRIVRALGYEDRSHFGQLSHNTAIGDLIEFLEDNSGAIDAVIEWIGDKDFPTWKEYMESELEPEEEEDEEDNSQD